MVTSTALESLKALPDRDILDKFKKFKKDEIEEMVKAERFVAALYDIPRFHERRECMKIKIDFVWEAQNVKNNISIVTQAIKEIRTSKKWAALLEFILLTGNFMNAGTKRTEKAHGFNLDILLKLKDTKSIDGSVSLAHFIAEWVTEKHNNILGWHKELPNVKEAQKICGDSDATSFNLLVEDVEKCRKELEERDHKKPFCDGDLFKEKMAVFVEEGKREIKVIREMQKNMTSTFTELLDFYIVDHKKSMEDFLKVVSEFAIEYQQFEKDNAKRKEAEEMKKKAYTKPQRKPAQQKPSPSEAAGAAGATIDLESQGDEGVLDGLMEALASGNAFRNQGRKKATAGGKPRNQNSMAVTGFQRRGTRDNTMTPIQSKLEKVLQNPPKLPPSGGDDVIRGSFV